MKNKSYNPQGSHGDPPIASGSRGHPPWITDPWGDHPECNDEENSAIPIRCLKATDRNSAEMNDCTLQKRYPLPSALADGPSGHAYTELNIKRF